MTSQVSNMIAPSAQLAAGAQYSAKQGRELIASTPEAPIAREKQTSPVDTVSLMNKAQQTATETQKEDEKKDIAKKEAARKLKSQDEPARSIGEVKFDYDYNGNLLVRFMDRANRLIYQIPPELVTRVAETISKSKSSVNMKA